jgi:hypothetical protein
VGGGGGNSCYGYMTSLLGAVYTLLLYHPAGAARDSCVLYVHGMSALAWQGVWFAANLSVHARDADGALGC